MISLETTTEQHLPKITEWIAADPWHRDFHNDPKWLLTGRGVLTFHIVDDEGPLCFVRLDSEGKMLRLATQFGPENEVSKRRLVVGLLECGIPTIKTFGQENGFKGIVFESASESLIQFMNRQGFFKTERDNEFALVFGRQI